jgi:lysophospholipase L1-like esterase
VRHPLAQNLALLFVSLALTLGALEAFLRYRRVDAASAVLAAYMQFDPQLGHRHRPGARASVEKGEYRTRVEINALGLRDPERRLEAEPGVLRVLVLGDSFVEGLGVAQDETLTRLVEARLRTGGKAVEVLNGGTAAYSTDQELLWYRSDGKRFAQVGVVLLCFFLNDLTGNLARAYKPWFLEADGGLELRGVPVRRERVEMFGPQREERSPSALYDWLRGRRPGFFGARPAPAEYFDNFRPKGGPERERAWSLATRLVAALRDDAAAQGAEFGLVGIPHRLEVDDATWEASRRAWQTEGAPADRGRVAARLARLARDLDVPFLDLTPALRPLGGRGYYEVDIHWTPEGTRAAADAVSAFLHERFASGL